MNHDPFLSTEFQLIKPSVHSFETRQCGAFNYYLYYIGLENQKAFHVDVIYRGLKYYAEIIEYTNGIYHYHIERRERMIADSRLGDANGFDSFYKCHYAILNRIVKHTRNE